MKARRPKRGDAVGDDDGAVKALRRRLAVARGQLRVLTAHPWIVGAQAPAAEGPAKFVNLVVANRGSFGVIYGLDSEGQVWERHTLFDKAAGKVIEEWWTPCGMERRTV